MEKVPRGSTFVQLKKRLVIDDSGQGIGLTLIKEVLLNHGYELSLGTKVPGRTEFVIMF